MRPIWSGTISFGLVSVSVRMFPATASKELRFHFLHRKDLGTAELQKAEVETAKSLVENLSEPFEPEKYDDTSRKELLDLIRAKAAGKPLPEPAQEQEGEVVDLMAALRESVERTKKQRRGISKRKAS